MTNTLANYKYTEAHEWIQIDGDIATIGITDHAQEALGDLVYVELPEIGKNLTKGEEAAVVESCKAASDVYAPISGEVIEQNTELSNSPENVNSSPYESGWIFKIRIADTAELDQLLDEAAYKDHIGDD